MRSKRLREPIFMLASVAGLGVATLLYFFGDWSGNSVLGYLLLPWVFAAAATGIFRHGGATLYRLAVVAGFVTTTVVYGSLIYLAIVFVRWLRKRDSLAR